MVLSPTNQSAVHCINPHCQHPYPQPWGNRFCSSCGSILYLLDRYYPIQPLGLGGFAQIYTVWDVKTQTQKVLKVLLESSPKALELFIQEAEVLSQFHNPGVPKVDGYFQVHLPYPKPYQLACLVMEKIEGYTLEQLLQNYPHGCPEDLVLNWFTQALKILRELHTHKIIHRDIKPSNLMLRIPSSNSHLKIGSLVLIDFGGAKQVIKDTLKYPSSTRLFSLGYSPPEQIAGGSVGPRADLYALGRTIIELLTGKHPQELEDPMTGKLQWRQFRRVNSQLADLLDEMIEMEVAYRPKDAASIQKRLLAITPVKSPRAIFWQWHNYLFQIIIQFTQKVTNTTILTIVTIGKCLFAVLAMIWTVILTVMGAGVGTILGFFLAYYTKVGDIVDIFISIQVSELIRQVMFFQPINSREVIVYALAGLGTSWGITLASSFGQMRKFLPSGILALIGYSLSWMSWQLVEPEYGKPIISLLISVSLLACGLQITSHTLYYILYYLLFNSLVVAVTLSFLISLKTPIYFIHSYNQPGYLELFQYIASFTLIGLINSFCLGLSLYVISPCFRRFGLK